MSLADDLKAARDPVRACPVCDWYVTLDPDDQQAFDEWVPSGGTRLALHRIAVKNGLNCWRGKLYDHIDGGHVPG